MIKPIASGWTKKGRKWLSDGAPLTQPMTKGDLVLIEWEDSTQPTSAWQFRDEVRAAVVRVASVGWLVKDGKRVKALAANVGGLDRKVAAQVSGVISIPTRCIISIKKLEEV